MTNFLLVPGPNPPAPYVEQDFRVLNLDQRVGIFLPPNMNPMALNQVIVESPQMLDQTEHVK